MPINKIGCKHEFYYTDLSKQPNKKVQSCAKCEAVKVTDYALNNVLVWQNPTLLDLIRCEPEKVHWSTNLAKRRIALNVEHKTEYIAAND